MITVGQLHAITAVNHIHRLIGQGYSTRTHPSGESRFDMTAEPRCRETSQQLMRQFTRCVKTLLELSILFLPTYPLVPPLPLSNPKAWMKICHVRNPHKANNSRQPDAFTFLILVYNFIHTECNMTPAELSQKVAVHVCVQLPNG